MRRWLLVLSLLVLHVSVVTAQGELEVITADNIDQLRVVFAWLPLDNAVVAATFSPDGQTLAMSPGNGTIQLMNTSNFADVRLLEGAEIGGERLQYSADGAWLMLANRESAHIVWDVASGGRLVVQPFSIVRGLFRVSDDFSSYLLYDYGLHRVTVHDLLTGTERIRVFQDSYPTPEINTDGSILLTRDEQANVQVWDTSSGEMMYELHPEWEFVVSSITDLQGMGFRPDGSIWTSWHQFIQSGESYSSESSIDFWNAETGQPITSFEGQEWYQGLFFDPSGRYVAAAGTAVAGRQLPVDSTFWILDAATGQQIGMRQGTSGGVELTFAPSGDLYAYAGGTSNSIAIVEVGVDRPLMILRGGNTGNIYMSTLQFASTGKLLLSVGTGVQVWGVSST